MKRRRTPGGAKPSETNSGRTILSQMVNGRVYHAIDFHDAFLEQGFQLAAINHTMGALCKEGAVVRIGYGAYRLPLQQTAATYAANGSGEPPSDALPGNTTVHLTQEK